MFALLDPARPEVPDAVLTARHAHIRVAMVTGDHPTTAAAIATKVNILSKEVSVDGGIDRFKILCNDETHETIAQFVRNTHTLLETHTVGELTTPIEFKGMKSISTAPNQANVCKRVWNDLLNYVRDPNQTKEVKRLDVIPFGVIVTGGDMHYMDVSDEIDSCQ